MRAGLGLGPLARSLTRWMVFQDPPDHTRLRGLVNQAFTPQSVERLRGEIGAIVERQLEEVTQRSSFDLISEVAAPLPVQVIWELRVTARAAPPTFTRKEVQPMLHARHRLFVVALTAAAVLAGAANAPAAFAVSSTQESCLEFVHTYLAGGLADGSSVTLALNVYSIGLPVAEVWDVPTVLTLRYPRFPVVAGWLISAATDSRGTRISADDGQLKVLVQTESSEPAVDVLGCRGPRHLYGFTGNEILGLAFGHPEPPRPPLDSSNIDGEWAPRAP